MSVDGEIEVFAGPKRKPHQNDSARARRERRHREAALDEALKDTFPASDPVSFEQPKRGYVGAGGRTPTRATKARRFFTPLASSCVAIAPQLAGFSGGAT